MLMNHGTSIPYVLGRQRNTVHVSVCMSVRITSLLLCTKLIINHTSNTNPRKRKREEKSTPHVARTWRTPSLESFSREDVEGVPV